MKSKNWHILNAKIEDKELEIADIVKILLENRGLKTEKAVGDFLQPKLEDLTFEQVDLNKEQITRTIQRIQEAIQKKEQIIIYGDYDVDGITASAILWETLHRLGAQVMPYIPHRVEEGYGLTTKGIENLLVKHPQTSLVITVDNGIVAHAAVDFAHEKKIDVIITDHHVASDTLPNAYAFVHTTKLCGAGVAYMLAREIQQTQGIWQQEQDDLLELATLGTIADLVPLQGGNRIIVKYGLPKLCRTKRMGLIALFNEAACDSSSIGVYEVGHVIAPRLNATGRMASAMDSLRLLCTKDRNRAAELASLLGVTNKERQTVMTDATKHASLSVKEKEELKRLLIVSHEDYAEGVIGLVAGRLVEEYYRPAIVISKGEKYSKGSVRSVNGFNIIEFLRQSADFFVNLGGHPMAAGFTIETEKIDAMQKALEGFAEGLLNDSILTRTIKIDCAIPLTHVTEKLYMHMQTLGPFGMANPEPVFVTENVQIQDMRILGRDGKHLRLTISQPNAVMEAIAFGMGERASEFHVGDAIDIAYTIDENNWNGRKKMQLKVKDIHTKNT